MTGPVDVVVLLASRWYELAGHRTRWREVVLAWREDPRVGRLTVVDYPSEFHRRLLLRPDRDLVAERTSWQAGVRELTLGLPVHPEVGWSDPLGYLRAARALRGALGAPDRARLVVSAWPIYAPLLRRLGATHTAFDAVDDWRAHPELDAQRHRTVRGYRAAAGHRSTAVSAALREVLHRDFGMTARVVPNGADPPTARVTTSVALPDGPFAVYVGSIQERVDLDLVRDVVSELGADLPVLLVGPVTPAAAAAAAASGATVVGPVPPGEVPAVLARASVGLLPHHDEALTRSMDPMKLAEYLAAGLPVVSTDVALPPDLAAHVTVARGAADFAAAVRAAVRSGRRAPVLRASWPDVADELLTHYLGPR